MKIRKALTALVATSLLFGGAASAAALGENALRQPAALGDSEQLGGAGIGWIIALVVAAGVAIVIIEDDEEPESP